jgi:response regulator RpfG family c-di-GMP phosphodiesterase
MITQKPRILCVDDEPSSLKLLDALLSARGFEVVKATNGSEALSIISGRKVDLVLLDAMMPGMSGFEVCSRVKKQGRYQKLPVIMITALRSKEDRIASIEAGADDFISKPFDQAELIARIRMLLRIKDLNDRLHSAYTHINTLVFFGKHAFKTFDPLDFDFLSRIDEIVGQILRRTDAEYGKPEMVLIGLPDEGRKRKWLFYNASRGMVRGDPLDLGVTRCPVGPGDESRVSFLNEGQIEEADIGPIIRMVEAAHTKVTNVVSCHISDLCIHAFNYGREVTAYDSAVLNNMVMQSLFFRSLSQQIKETDDAFSYTVQALARAAEVNDEDTGDHIIRVGEYCALIARRLNMTDKFVSMIRLQAQMHDVGKIHIPPEILKKPGKLTTEEFELVKKHPENGAKILGDHVRLTMAKNIALSHHERWDGSGYPCGLKGEQIPTEGRILNIADQYDALRTPRVYKQALDHETTRKIITEGDGRTMPHHFDPAVQKAFRETASQFEEIYGRLKS